MIEIDTAVLETEFADERPYAVYRLYGADGVLLYVGIAWNLPQRMEDHAANKWWWWMVARRTMIWYPSELEARAAEAIAIDIENPLHNDVRPAVGPTVPPHGQRKGWNKTPLIGWHSADPTLKPWIKAEAARREITERQLLDEALIEYRVLCEIRAAETTQTTGEQQ